MRLRRRFQPLSFRARRGASARRCRCARRRTRKSRVGCTDRLRAQLTATASSAPDRSSLLGSPPGEPGHATPANLSSPRGATRPQLSVGCILERRGCSSSAYQRRSASSFDAGNLSAPAGPARRRQCHPSLGGGGCGASSTATSLLLVPADPCQIGEVFVGSAST
jgi:hypothetical protein